MFFTKFFYFCKGYVIIEVSGFSIERFINICVRRSIQILSLERHENSCIIKLSISDFKKVRPIAFKTKSKIRLLKKASPFYALVGWRKRRLFWAGAMLCLLFFAVTSQFIWKVEINGVDRSDMAAIQNVLEQNHIKTGAWKGSIPPASQIKQEILSVTKNVSWAWMYRKGTTLRIEIHETALPPELTDPMLACDIVAARDGLITKIITKDGRELMQEGEACVAGEVIVAGTVELTDGYYTVHADAQVEARTYHEKSGEYKLYGYRVTPAGRTRHQISPELFSLRFDLFPFVREGEDDETEERIIEPHIGSYYPGIRIYHRIIRPVNRERYQIPYDTAAAMAKDALQQQIGRELLPGAVLEKEDFKTEQLDEETIRATLSMEFTQKIGIEKPIGVS